MIGKYVKANWEEIKIGNNYYDKIYDNDHNPMYHEVKILDKTETYVIYQYKNGFRIRATKNQYREYYLYKYDTEKVYLF